MKLLSSILISFGTLCIVGLDETYAAPSTLHARDDLPYVGNLMGNVTDITQKSSKEVTRDDPNIQWNFTNSSSTPIELRDSNCENPEFPQNTDRSYLRLMFNTSDLLKLWDSQFAGVTLKVHCPNEKYNQATFRLSGKTLMLDFDYTFMTVFVGRCKNTKKRRVEGIELKIYGNYGDINGHSMGVRALSPHPNSPCTHISNFKTAYIPTIPYGTS